MLQTEGLKYRYDQENAFDFPDINCGTGEHCLILGPSGTGKSTLLHLLGGLMRPRQGEIRIAGTSIGGLSEKQLDHFRGREIGIIFQRSHFVRSLNVGDNLALARNLAGEQPAPALIDRLLSSLNLNGKKSAMPYRLSQGEQQRVAIARALINEPRMILADEPTSALDDQNCSAVLELLRAQADAQNALLVIVTHDTRLKGLFTKQYMLN